MTSERSGGAALPSGRVFGYAAPASKWARKMAAGKTGKKRELLKAQNRDRDRSPGRDVAAWRIAIDEMLVDVALSHLGDANGSLPECYAWLEGKWSILAELGRLAANGDHGIVVTVAKGLCEIEQPVKLSERMVRNIRLMMK